MHTKCISIRLMVNAQISPQLPRCALYSEGYHWDHVQVVLFTSFLVRMILSAMVPMCGFSVLLVNLIHVKE